MCRGMMRSRWRDDDETVNHAVEEDGVVEESGTGTPELMPDEDSTPDPELGCIVTGLLELETRFPPSILVAAEAAADDA